MLRHRYAIILSGLIWMGIGLLLLNKGLHYLVAAGQTAFSGVHEGFSLILLFKPLFGSAEKSAMFLLCLGLFIGFIKGRIVLKKSVHRVVNRIRSFPSPISFKNLYSKGYYLLIASMMLMGFVFKVLPLPLDVKGFIDFTIGIALINGAMLYFRAAFVPQKTSMN